MLHFLNSNHDQLACRAPLWEGSLPTPLGLTSGAFWRQHELCYFRGFLFLCCCMCLKLEVVHRLHGVVVKCLASRQRCGLLFGVHRGVIDHCFFPLYLVWNGTADTCGYFCYFFSPISDTPNGWGTFEHYSFLLD